MVEQKVSVVNSSGEKLIGLETKPSVEQPQYPAVIMVHGFYGNKDECGIFTTIVSALAEQGIVGYRFDLSGCGESEGSYAETTLTKLAEDVESILEFVESQPSVDRVRIGLIGFSLGTTAILALRPRNIRCLVMIGSVAHPYEILQVLFDEGFHPQGVSSRLTSSGKRVEVGPQFWQDFQRYNLIWQMRSLRVPTLFIHGEKDEIVPRTEVDALFNAAAEPKELVIVPGDKHVITDLASITKAIAWLEQYLK
ncbi:hypothetical protein A3H10_02495 [Candidatus Uhrbacteria bacterium RIFCSPLOWO2_12_FULL_46_10]|uniref:AB hydrolase-1 domain-containing protein n=1 Tax=Candidatus Uhrbacteria bacterium RIFCSPLOWO2_01_FULL_47_25 TaxID=1802402 RepID=A0A1F7UVW0_9BACT|nr:MAG: hypothetical protein A2752_04870 [Candidatus Uhrbacteria bacterium RIFCSPHIGHO2_01_FULL_46_23]OGL69407.1 MAG: hypothetical protein A3D60_01025 [Candidatus Uhrbacteria bacterium RIFCSPHIGHO2_02_FULL_47_29]OGL76790.1 MAG: hypothetical protein A3E96_01620 [Candidatus Uhrbacteria bacterium RIFCSPHIGHO2_12_FULL_46_13]OGL82431.1 MAG: hypothetical protein A2936_03165 [Candidatus Uhrbacteria bacterium RIFCSPLOWO2_01_FULL_47_25]OGL91481.1 MAG: hypothetical protein A3H10_02495 [Candidatus Uhrbact